MVIALDLKQILMKLIQDTFRTPQENLAFEEWYFRHFEEETIRIWRNPSSVILGKHQNAYAESNFLHCQESNTPIIRRISGGGTVYHDLGNINFSFFRFVDTENPISYVKNLELIKGCLKLMGYDVIISPRNDLFVGNYKVSGNAQHLSKGRVLHHGTILYDTNKPALDLAIKRSFGRYIDKSVKSVRSSVINLREVLDLGSTSEFLLKLIDALKTQTQPTTFRFEKPDDELLKKYHDPNWNFHYGPGYVFYSDDSIFPISLEVDRGGLIRNATSPDLNINDIVSRFIQCKHSKKELNEVLGQLNLDLRYRNSLLKKLF